MTVDVARSADTTLSTIAASLAHRVPLRLVIRTLGGARTTMIECIPCVLVPRERPIGVIVEHRNAVWRPSKSTILLESILAVEVLGK